MHKQPLMHDCIWVIIIQDRKCFISDIVQLCLEMEKN